MRSFFPCLSLVAVLSLVFFSSFQAMSQTVQHSKQNGRPNIIVIITDDQRWDMMGCAGNSIIQTPNMDKLAKDGVRFSHAFSSTPICAASRASILTGLYERKHGFSFGTPPVSKAHSDISYPYMLRQSGYQTGIVGKLGVKFETSIDSLFTWKRINGFPYWKVVDGKKTFLTDIQRDQSIEFIKASAEKGPFCLSISFSAPHADDDSKEQYFWPEDLDSFYRNATIPVPSTADPAFYEALPDFLKGTMSRERWYWRFDTPEKYQSMVKGYYRMITGIDQALGRIRNTLDELGIADNTVIILMGDNGYFLGDRGFADKWLMHEASIRVPLIYYDPRKKPTANTVNSDMVMNIDLAPTILELAGVKVPALVQGESLISAVNGNNKKKRSSIFCEHLMKNPKIPNSEGIRTAKWKFIRYPKHPEFIELYDLKNDPWEEHNLADDPRYRKMIARFQSQCDSNIMQLSKN